jgi:thioredoxin-like negative regulator of GroEL
MNGLLTMEIAEMKQITEVSLEEIYKDSTKNGEIIFLVEVRAEWRGSSHIVAPIIKRIESEFKHLIEVRRIDLESNKKTLNEICAEFIPSVLFVKNGELLEILSGTFSKKSIEKILLDLLDGSSV